MLCHQSFQFATQRGTSAELMNTTLEGADNSAKKGGKTCSTGSISPFDSIVYILYNMYMQQRDYLNVRVRQETHRQLKIVAALRQESMLDTLTHLVQQEYDRLQQEGGKRHAADEKDQA